MSASVRDYGFQTAPMPSEAMQAQTEARDREERSRERNARIGKVAGIIIGSTGLLGIVVVPSIAIGRFDNFIVGFAGSLVSLGVAYLGFSIFTQATSNYPCCNCTPSYERNIMTDEDVILYRAQSFY